MPELRELRLFVSIVRAGSISAAARELGMSQPALSRSLARLERLIGRSLIERDSHRFEVTAAGRVLFSEATDLLAAAEAALRRTERAGTTALVVAAKPDSDLDLLPQVLDDLADADDPLEISIMLCEQTEVIELVRRAAADVALLAGPVERRGVAVVPLHSEPRVVVFSGDHPYAARRQLRLDETTELPIARWPAVPEALDRYYQGRDGAGAGMPPGTGPQVRDLSEVLRLAELGRAATFLPQSVAARYRRPRLVSRRVRGLSESQLVAVRRAGVVDQRIDRFISCCHGILAERGGR